MRSKEQLILIIIIFSIISPLGCDSKLKKESSICVINSSYMNLQYVSSIRNLVKDTIGLSELISMIDQTTIEIAEKAGGFNMKTNSLVKGCQVNRELVYVIDSLKIQLAEQMNIIKNEGLTNEKVVIELFENYLNLFFFSDECLFSKDYLFYTNMSTVYNDLILCQNYLLLTMMNDIPCLSTCLESNLSSFE